MPERPISTAIVASPAQPTADTLTLDHLLKVMKEGQKQIDDLDDQLVESLLVCGFRVIINDDLPHGMIAVLPGNFKGSLRRALAKLKAGHPTHGVFINMNMIS